MNKIKIAALFVIGFSGFSQAGTVISCVDKSNAHKMNGYSSNYDYGDAPSSYGVACHDTDRWQNLGNDWDVDSATNVVDSDNTTDDGVSWRTSSDGGNTWSDWSSDQVLRQGDQVEFKFEVTRSNDGGHEYDELKAWVDWNQDSNWDNASEVVEQEVWNKNEAPDGTLDTSSPHYNGDLGTNNSNITFATFYETLNIPLDAVLGDTWMRARVVCENSLSQYSVNHVLDATGYQHQGEVEDYKLTVVAKAVSVPEPSTLFIFALSLIGLAVKRRKSI